jgi:ETFB lysine methyltransferase
MEPVLENLRQHFPLALSQVAIRDWQFELYRPSNPDDLLSDLDFERDGRLPYWAELWPSASALATRIAAEEGGGRRLLELGCGLGLASLAAIRAGFDVTATDYYDEALAFTELNTRHNGLPPPATRLVDWRKFPDDLGRFDLVVASDVLFEKLNVPLVAAAFSRTIGPGGRGMITDPGRPPAEAFSAECERHGLRIVERSQIPVAKPDQPAAPQMIHLHELFLAAGATPASIRPKEPRTQ